jgi:hypothetical protein
VVDLNGLARSHSACGQNLPLGHVLDLVEHYSAVVHASDQVYPGDRLDVGDGDQSIDVLYILGAVYVLILVTLRTCCTVLYL